MLQNRGICYSGLNILSAFVARENYDASKNSSLCKYIKEIFNKDPLSSKYTFQWDVGRKIQYLRNDTTTNLKDL